MTREHRIAALILGLLVPLGSRVLGAGELSFRMYAHAPSYRLDVFAVDETGARHRVAPTALARGARASVVPLVAGADHWRTQPGTEELRAALPKLASHACRLERGSRSIEITLEERAREGEPVVTSRAVASCAP